MNIGRLWPVRDRRCADDHGFTLTEVGVALFVSVILLTLFAQSLSVTFRVSREDRAQEQATLLSIEGIELARGLTWGEIAMTAVDPGDTRVSGGQLLASAADLQSNENVVVDSTNGVIEPIRTETLDDVAFEIWQYVTDAQPGLRRVVVFVTWDFNGGTREHHTSTLFSDVRYDT